MESIMSELYPNATSTHIVWDLLANYTLNETFSSGASDVDEDVKLDWYYAGFEVLVGLVAVIGNALVITVFGRERRLRRRTNYYIVSLAVADFLVGLLGVPFAILTSIGLPANSLYTCLFSLSLLMVLCTISIFCLVAVSVDRYWAILHPMDYSRNFRTRTALVFISICWIAGCLIGFLPLMGWHKRDSSQCIFLKVMDYNYLVFLYIVTIITPALVLAVFYTHIYHVVLKQIRKIVTMNPENGSNSLPNFPSGGTMLRILGAARKREVTATQNLSIIVLFFMLCWIPLYTINCILAFCEVCRSYITESPLMMACIILSHLNSAINPLLYAYHLKDFRAAMKRFIYGLVGIKLPPFVNGRSHGSHYTSSANNIYRIHRNPRGVVTITNKPPTTLSSPYGYTRSGPLTNPKITASIVSNTITLAATAAATDGPPMRRPWALIEIPSTDSSNINLNFTDRRIAVPSALTESLNIERYRPNSVSDTSSHYNSDYMDHLGDEDDDDVFDDEDDDVLLEDTIPIRDFTCSRHRNNCKFISGALNRNVVFQPAMQESSSDSNVSSAVTPTVITSDTRETAITGDLANRDSELSQLRVIKKPVVASPAKSLRLSPFKAVSDFLLGKHRSASLSDGSRLSADRGKSGQNGYTTEIHSCG